MALAAQLVAAGAALIDIGGESGVTNRPAVDAAEEIERVVPLIERVVAELGVRVSVDTYKPAVAAGGDRRRRGDRQRRQRPARSRSWPTCARRPAPAWSSCTRARAQAEAARSAALDGRIGGRRQGASCASGSSSRSRAASRSSSSCSTPGRTSPRRRRRRSRCCARCRRCTALGRPVLLAVSRKDFVGAITGRAPARAARRHAGRGRRTASAPARTCCASTMSPPRATSSTCWAALRRSSSTIDPGLRLADAVALAAGRRSRLGRARRLSALDCH